MTIEQCPQCEGFNITSYTPDGKTQHSRCLDCSWDERHSNNPPPVETTATDPPPPEAPPTNGTQPSRILLPGQITAKHIMTATFTCPHCKKTTTIQANANA